jgi:hypothetical protein
MPAGEASAAAEAQADFMREWIRRGTLLSLAMDAAQTVKWPKSELKLAASTGYAFRRLVLVTVVTYCYANGVYDPKEIALKIARDEILRFLCVGTFPTCKDIEDFSRRHSDLIANSLMQTNELAQRYGLPIAAGGSANWEQDKAKGLNDSPAVDLEVQIARQAETRIKQAAH